MFLYFHQMNIKHAFELSTKVIILVSSIDRSVEFRYFHNYRAVKM